jgi:hypothetical protein
VPGLSRRRCAFVKAALADGATGLLQFQDGTPALTSKQWSELDTALGMPRN